MLFKILVVLTLLAFLFVVLCLVMGTIAMGGKDAKDRERSNKWMQRRVYGQVAAIALLFVTFAVRTGD